MRTTRHPLLLPLLAVCAVAAPAPAVAAEGFVAIQEDGRLVQLQSDSLPAVTTPMPVRGMVPRERLLALGHGGGRIFGVGSSARLYELHVRTGRAKRIGPPFAQGLRGQRFSLVVSATGRSARLFSDVGQELIVDTTRGGVAEGAGLRRKDGSMAFPAVDRAPDGGLVGVDVKRRELLREEPATAPPPPLPSPPPATEPAPAPVVTAPALAAIVPATMLPTTLKTDKLPTVVEPAAFTVDGGGNGWLAAAADFAFSRRRQTTLQRLDLTTAEATGLPVVLARRLEALSAIGPVADDKVKPRVSVRLPPRLSVGRVLGGQLPSAITASEGVMVSAWFVVGGQRVGASYQTTDVPGPVTLRGIEIPTDTQRRLLSRSVGQRATLAVYARDWAGNSTRVFRRVRLVR